MTNACHVNPPPYRHSPPRPPRRRGLPIPPRNNPLDIKDGWFWGEAALQGGAAGFYGDFLKEAFSRSGTSLTEAAIGPLASIPAAVQRLTSGARREAESGEHVNFGAALADDIGRFTPGSSQWYGRLIFNRLVVDNVHRLIDPDYARSFQRRATTHRSFTISSSGGDRAT